MAFIKKRYLWILVAIIVLSSVIIVFGKSGLTSDKIHTVQSGAFELAINLKGEVQGKNAVVINLPDELKRRDLRIYELEIKDMVQEGTVVKKGGWIATLDAGTINQRMQSNTQELTKYRAELNDAKIDSAIRLTTLREELEEFTYDLEYKKLELEQSKYESPAYQRKKQVEFNKTIRQMEKKRRDYELTRIDLKRRTSRTENKFKEFSRKDSLFKDGLKACRVKAPKEGMVMYAKLWGGRKLRIGDKVSIWSPAIANLPDMSVLVSETYIEEIDITKIAIGDSVEINIDALPNKTYSGIISKIANIGQELAGFDTKVFRILIDMNENGKEIKPSMTTDNKIILKKYDDVVKIPREYLFSDNGNNYVFLKKDGKIWKQKVVAGLENDEEIVIISGLNVKDKIYTSIPEDDQIIAFSES
ncbi:MAG: HlyD family efflux transporter periplasmic adaptor subunit [Bacteroidetes bacterium]|nr:HlyD family efflux transporter periplasmic adaptor subunit [Bacteroidota bacterium]